MGNCCKAKPVRVDTATAIGKKDIVFYDAAQKPFDCYGLLYEPGKGFFRIPEEVAKSVNEGVAGLYCNTAGGRIRFTTDSPYVAVRFGVNRVVEMSHFPMNGSSGMDLYLDTDNGSLFTGVFAAEYHDNICEGIIEFPDASKRQFTLNLPLYSDVQYLYIGLAEGACVEKGRSYRGLDPVVYYGSSITQGGCAGRPGCSYQSIICRRNDIDYLNLGFSGSARGEQTIIDYMCGLKMSAFVSDYDHNAPDPEWLKRTHYHLYESIREKHPDIPYLMVTRPWGSVFYQDDVDARRKVVYDSYMQAVCAGDRNVWFVDGDLFWSGEEASCCIVDNCHPNDHGFVLMADAIGKTLDRAFAQQVTR
ncbi:MAG: hypothetical protein IJR83_07565 [Clostridia bacterium]|nr:hypothetical protein [Clostridia bacterium]